jgi:tRNA (mo5U34)-methyltransferase
MRRFENITDLASGASLFRKRLDQVKRDIALPDVDWYPYDSFAVFPVLTSMLREDRRDLLALAGAAPILDIGCGDGALSFFFESLGCRVLAIDNTSPNFNGTLGFSSLHTALDSSVEFQMCDLDTGVDLSGRTFGLALCLGVLYHLKNPFLLLEMLAKHARHCLLSTRIAQVTPGGSSIAEEPIAYLLNPFEANNDASNYWIFSEAGLRRILDRTGWELCDYKSTGFKKGSNPSDCDRDERAFCMLRSKLADPWLEVDLDGGWHAMENESWRWTERVFSVRMTVAPPADTATLRFRFTLPEAILNATGPIRLHATVGTERLPACEYDFAGEHTYEQKIPRFAANNEAVSVRFELDKACGPTLLDRRELGLQVVFWSYGDPTPRALRPVVLCY